MLLAILIMIVPLLWPPIPPLVDLPAHLGRYHVALDIGRSTILREHWTYRWHLIGNLGVDLAVMPLAPLIGLEPATKLIILAIPALFALGLYRLSRAVDGHVSPLLPMAFALAYGFPFQFGFVNFMLGAALALNTLPAWIRLGRQERFRLRALLFVPVSSLIWVAHSFGWGILGAFAFVAELIRLREHRLIWRRALPTAALHCSVMALPLLWTALSLTGGSGGGGIEFDWSLKPFWIICIFRERWMVYDKISALGLLVALFIVAWRRTNFRFEPHLGGMALAAGAAFLLLPRAATHVALIDARMPGVAIALALAAVRTEAGAEKEGRIAAFIATAFFTLRMVTSTVALAHFSATQTNAIDAVDHLPRGAAVIVLVNQPSGVWSTDRLEHVDGIAIDRRDAFTNGQWVIAGQQLIAPRHEGAEPYRADPSQLASSSPQKEFAQFDRRTFRYLWLIDFPPALRPAPDLKRIWANERSQLFQTSAAPPLSPIERDRS